MKTSLIFVSISIMMLYFAFNLSSCKKDEKAEGTDKVLFDMAKNTSGFVWYKNSAALLPKSTLSGHNEPLLRTRFNAVAANMLDSAGKVNPGITFPDGSVIVKELYSNSSTLSTYAVLYKKAGHADADSDNWVWGYIREDGTVREPARNKGNACRGCHGQSGNIDFSLMNVSFP